MSTGELPRALGPAQQSSFDVGVRLAQRHGELEGRPAEFELLGLRWDLLPEVFAPIHTASTELFSQWLPYPNGGSFLEIGCGTGVIAVTAALRGCASVSAVDIVPAAVRNTGMNAARHGVADRVRVLRSDMFDALDADQRFDVVFWNSNVIPAPADFDCALPTQRAIFDPGYAAHDRYLREGIARLTENGRLFLGFNSLGDLARLRALAALMDLRVTEMQRATHRTGNAPVTFQLLEISAEHRL
ncbi:methyltransferase domain-containing protein [Saccharopolyspora sp. NPDC050389]|uniref:methyltransferase domain-containing protein n=1 Tax=Saccharopolyspora sp. NPDC050389 TaxID=3155516 RepID=UPI0033E38C18